ncbi:MAG: Hsp20/alpha crystallin family protein [Planctomycetes bacterium]|nr:Hsp20/alpha crystallin family protein [Planctomycetota bacterium]
MQKNQNNPPAPQSRDPFQSLIGRLFGDALQEFYGTPEANQPPRTNIAETETAYELEFELPGVVEKDIQVQMHDHVLTVTAERQDARDVQGKRWHRVEHRYGQYTRTIALPQDATSAGIEAVYKQGLLTVTVPKAPESRPTRIQVRSV